MLTSVPHSRLLRLAALILVALCLMVPRFPAAIASHEHVIQITQPIASGGAGLMIADVPYVVQGSPYFSRGSHVLRTTYESRIETHRGPESRNAANAAGFIVRLIDEPDAVQAFKRAKDDPAWDTLAVAVDMRSASEYAILADGEKHRVFVFDRLLPALLDCLVLNATRERPQPKYLELSIEGNAQFEDYAGVYVVPPEQISTLPREPVYSVRALQPSNKP